MQKHTIEQLGTIWTWNQLAMSKVSSKVGLFNFMFSLYVINIKQLVDHYDKEAV